MIQVKEIYDAVAKDYINSAENGDLNFDKFNRLSKKGELRLIDFLSGDIENMKPPVPYTSEKLRDYLSFFIVKKPQQVIGGSIPSPEDYYGFENMYMVGSVDTEIGCSDVAEGIPSDNTPIELVSGAEFTQRPKSFIKALRPSYSKPIAKKLGGSFEFLPTDLGTVTLEYIRYPKFASIISKVDNVYNQLLIDESLSINYEYGEWATELLVYFIAQEYAIGSRDDSLLGASRVTGKLVRDEK